MDVSVLVATKAGSIMGPIASVFGYIMDFLFRITSSMGIMNIGLCIILFTIITKLLLFPLTIKQQESSKLMSLMNPEIKAVQNRYKGKTDQASMAKQQVENHIIKYIEKWWFKGNKKKEKTWINLLDILNFL